MAPELVALPLRPDAGRAQRGCQPPHVVTPADARYRTRVTDTQEVCAVVLVDVAKVPALAANQLRRCGQLIETHASDKSVARRDDSPGSSC